MAHTPQPKNFLLHFRVGHGGSCRGNDVRFLIGHIFNPENKREKSENKIVAYTGGVEK